MDWTNWKIYFVIAILVAIVIIILWYRCPTVDYERLPGRPDSQKFLAPAPVLNDRNLYTFCDLPLTISTGWGCNFDTTIYNVSDIHFNLSYIDSNGNEIPINNNIANDTDGLDITNVEADYNYIYEYSLNDISPGHYTLKIESFVPNVPEATVRHCDTCTQDLTLLPSQYEPVSEVRLNQTFWYEQPHGQSHIDPRWDIPTLSPLLNENDTFYHLSIEDENGNLVPGTTVVDIAYDVTLHSYGPSTIPVGDGYQVVIYVYNNSNQICTGNSNETRSDPFDIVPSSMPTPTVTSEQYCSSALNFPVEWNFDCTEYAGPGECPDDFRYSVHVSDVNQGFDLFFDNILNSSASTDDTYYSDDESHSGKLTVNPTNNYAFTITPMLPLGTYTMIVSMFIVSILVGSPVIDQESDNSNQTPTPQAVVDVYGESVGNIQTDKSSYVFDDIINCTWDGASGCDYTYTYNITIVDDNGTSIGGCNGIEGTAFAYKVSKLPTTNTNCLINNSIVQPFRIQLPVGNNYKINIETSTCDPMSNCVTDNGGVISDSSFTISECFLDSDCIQSKSETNLLETDSYARMIYELQCSYVDDIETCMRNNGYQFDSREVPSTCQIKQDTGTSVCFRKNCPPMSVPYRRSQLAYYAGCTAPYNDPFPYNPADNDTGESGYLSFNNEVTSTASGYQNAIQYGYPFVAIIEGGTDPLNSHQPVYSSDRQIDISDTSKKVAVPGMTGNGDIYLMPVPIQNFHPFMAWRTFGAINNQTDFEPKNIYIDVSYGGGCWGYMFNLYHIGSNTFLDTNNKDCHATTGDDGVSCTLRIRAMDEISHFAPNANTGNAITCKRQPSNHDNKINACMTWNIWRNNRDAGFPSASDVDISSTAPQHTGNCTAAASTTDYSGADNNWNAPMTNTKQRQDMVFFGGSTTDSAKLYHRSNSDKNKISHMRVWTVDSDNLYFWKIGLGKGNSHNYTASDGSQGVYQVLAEQWPNGPPYTSPNERLLNIKFSAPIQYGIVPSYDQTNFSLEAYTWNEDKDNFKGLGFISTGAGNYNGYLNRDIISNWQISKDQEPNDISYMNVRNLFGDTGLYYYLNYEFRDPGNYHNFVFNRLSIAEQVNSGVIKFWPNGNIYMQLNSDGTNSDGTPIYYWLCVDPSDQSLKLINMKGTGYPGDFTLLMLAISWEMQES